MTALDALLAGRVGVRIQELADACGTSRDVFERAISRGDLRAFGWEGLRLIDADSIREWVSRGVQRRTADGVENNLLPQSEALARPRADHFFPPSVSLVAGAPATFPQKRRAAR